MARTLAARGLAQADSRARRACVCVRARALAGDPLDRGGQSASRPDSVPAEKRSARVRRPARRRPGCGAWARSPEPPTAALHRERQGKPADADRKRSCAVCLGDEGSSPAVLSHQAAAHVRVRVLQWTFLHPASSLLYERRDSGRCGGGDEAGGERSSCLAQRSGGG